MSYESTVVVDSCAASGVRYTVAKVSFERRMELMRRIRELARRMDFLEAGETPAERMDAGLLRAEIDRAYVLWGVRGVVGLEVDGKPATPESLAESGPEELFREALTAVYAQLGLTGAERKN
jgi:hypothetical protein